MDAEPLSRFLSELASKERLRILESLARKPHKHSAIARSLSITGSETTRHLNRLIATGLVIKNPRGEYGLTPLGRILLEGLPLYDFILTHREYLLAHQTPKLERPFLVRLGELARGSLVQGTYEVVAVQEASLRAVERRIWVITEQRFEQARPILAEKAARGADVRVIRARRPLEEEQRGGRGFRRNFPVRVLEEVGIFLAVLDDQAGLCLPTLEGKVDLATMLLLADPEGYRWAADLFLSFWNRGTPWEGGPPRGPRELR